jgi:hypothetical protein
MRWMGGWDGVAEWVEAAGKYLYVTRQRKRLV